MLGKQKPCMFTAWHWRCDRTCEHDTIQANLSSVIQRKAESMTSIFIRAYPPAQPTPGDSYWLPFHNDKVLVQGTRSALRLIQGGEEIRELFQPSTVLYLGTLEGRACLTCTVDPAFPLPDGWSELTQHQLFGYIDEQANLLVGYAVQILQWQRTSQYCPVCGHSPEPVPSTWGKVCPNCGHTSYPPVTPAVLVLVHDGERVLLTHKPGWGKTYSCIAGFVEPGETLEDCVRREVREEVVLDVTDVRYVDSQPWPFPHQIMIGYTARYAGGELQLDQQELDDARWFHVDSLPALPFTYSLSYHMITSWVKAQQERE